MRVAVVATDVTQNTGDTKRYCVSAFVSAFYSKHMRAYIQKVFFFQLVCLIYTCLNTLVKQ